MKKLIAAGIAALLLIYMTTASASTSGTETDPLVSLSYLDGTFTESMMVDIKGVLSDASLVSVGRLDELYARYVGFNFVRSFTRISLAAGDTVVLGTGASFVLLSGTATVAIVNGAVINVSTGAEVAAGERLFPNQRYFCAEDTISVIAANSSSIGHVDGYFHLANGLLNLRHPVFRDIMQDDWYHPAVDFVYSNGIFSGTSDDTFSPSLPMTRGMLVLVLYRLDGEPEIDAISPFSDVADASLYYHSAVIWANANEIVRGYSSGAFGPNDPVTREQMATFLYRYAEYKRGSVSAPDLSYEAFPDSGEISDYALGAMRWAVSCGVLNGSGGRLLPRNAATRAEVAQIVSNYIKTGG